MKLHESLLSCSAHSTSAKRLETTQQANFTPRSHSVWCGRSGFKIRNKPKTLPNSPPGMEKSFSKRAHFCTWKKIGLKQFKSAAKASYSYQLLQHNEINHNSQSQVIWRGSSTVGISKKKYDKHGTFSSALSTWSSQLLLIQTSVISRKIYHLYSPIKQEPTDADILSEPAVFVFDVAYGALVSAPTCLWLDKTTRKLFECCDKQSCFPPYNCTQLTLKSLHEAVC